MKHRNHIASSAAAVLLAVVPTERSQASVFATTFDFGPDHVFTVADASSTLNVGMAVSPSTYGTLGRFKSSSLLCLGPTDTFAGTGNPIGLFNIDATGAFSTAKTFSIGSVIDNNAGKTGWGVLSGNTTGKGLTAGTYNLGFRTSTGNYGWMNVTLNENGTSKSINDDVITVNAAYVESVVGQSITVTPVPEPTSVFAAGLGCAGFAAWRLKRRDRTSNKSV